MSEGPQQDNNPTIPSGMKPISEEALRMVETPHITNVTEGTDEVQGLHDRNKRAMDRALFEQEEFHKAKTRRKVIFTAIASFAAATVLALGGVSLLNRLSSNSPSQALLDSNKQLSGLETVVAALRATGTRLSGDNNALVNSRDSISSTNKTNLDLLNACVTDKNALQQGNKQLRDSSNNAQATIDSLKATNEALSGRLIEISNTVLSPSQVISLVAQALTNGDHETLKWFESYGCKLPTETPTSTSTTGFIPSWTPTQTQTPTGTPTSTPTSTPGSTETPNNPTNTPEQFKTPTKSNPPTQIPPDTATPEPTRTTVPPTATEMPTVVPTPTKASFPTQIPGTTRTAVPNVN